MKSEKLIWILEDDAGSQFVYEESLGMRYPLRVLSTLAEFKSAVASVQSGKERAPDLLIADLRLPDASLLDFVNSGEASGLFPFSFPFIVVSSVDDLDALRLCFSRGARDYITKPFGKGEIVVKVERIFSGMSDAKTDEARNFFNVDPISLTIRGAGEQSSSLTSKEFQIVTAMKQAPDHCIAKDDLINQVWGRERASASSLDVHLSNLRKKIAPLGLEIVFTPPGSYTLSQRESKLVAQG